MSADERSLAAITEYIWSMFILHSIIIFANLCVLACVLRIVILYFKRQRED
jgi:hypothetical protein